MRTSRAEQDRFIREWQASGLNMAAFTRHVGIPYHRLKYWVTQRSRDSCVPDAEPGFDEFLVTHPVTRGDASAAVVVHVSQAGLAMSLAIHDQTSASLVAQVVREVFR